MVKDVINTELSNRNNELTMSDYRIVFEPRGYARKDGILFVQDKQTMDLRG